MPRHSLFRPILITLLAGALPTTLLARDSAMPQAGASLAGTSLAEERAALARATAQADQARKHGEALEARAASAAASADRTRDETAALAARIQQSEADLRAGQARIALIAAQQRAEAHRLAQRQRPIAHLTAALQQIARRSPVLALVEPGTVSEAVHRRIVLAQALPVILARTRDLRAELARSADLRRSAEVAASSLVKTRSTLIGQREALAAREQRQRLAARALHENAGIANERALAMAEQARDIGDLMDQIEAAGTVRDALLRLPGPTLRPNGPGAPSAPPDAPTAALPGPAPSTRPPAYRLPVVGEVVTGFGEVSSAGVRARGLTIATAPLATVVAPAGGRIAMAGPFRGYGRILIIEHGDGWTSLIANLGALTAVTGDLVRAGDPVGSAGPGHPQLLVELRHGEQPVDIAALVR